MNRRRFVASVLAVTTLMTFVASDARPAGSGQVTISMLTISVLQPGYEVLIPNFERVYPNITVDATYVSPATVSEFEASELAAGNAPDLLVVNAGCGTPASICELAKAGDLAPLVKEPWARRSLPSVISSDKYGQGLFAFSPAVTPYGMFVNDDAFKRLGLSVPETFPQLLSVCQKTNDDGTAAVLLDGATASDLSGLIEDLAVVTVYGQDKHWTSELRAGTVSFDGSPGWRMALQRFVDMDNAGCFQPGATGTMEASAEAEFAQGQGLILPGTAGFKGAIDVDNPPFSYSFHPFPGATLPNQTSTWLSTGSSVGVNAHSNPQNQAAAQTFIDFIARPEQDALFAKVQGILTQYEFLKGQIPSFMSSFAPVFDDHQYVASPFGAWWNPNVLLALRQDAIGLITGQATIDDVLNAMDVAWKQGPS